MARAGLNANLSYSYNGKKYAFALRVKEIAHGSRMVADESQARNRRAYYPHKVSSMPFSVVPIIKGYQERVQFSNYLADYIRRVQDPSLSVSKFPTMRVTVASRNFERYGVPIDGIEWGDHVGSMVWNPRVTFETHVDQSIGDSPGNYNWISYFSYSDGALDRSPQLAYFYPSGIQLSGSEVPIGAAYDTVTTIQDIQDIINGGTKGPSDKGDVNPDWGGIPYLPGQGPTQNVPLGPIGR